MNLNLLVLGSLVCLTLGACGGGGSGGGGGTGGTGSNHNSSKAVLSSSSASAQEQSSSLEASSLASTAASSAVSSSSSEAGELDSTSSVASSATSSAVSSQIVVPLSSAASSSAASVSSSASSATSSVKSSVASSSSSQGESSSAADSSSSQSSTSVSSSSSSLSSSSSSSSSLSSVTSSSSQSSASVSSSSSSLSSATSSSESSSLSSSSSSSAVSSQSSMSSSSWSAADCSAADGEVFIDKTCDGWSQPSVTELQKPKVTAGTEVALGVAGNLVTLQVVDSGDSLHHQVLDVQYNGNSDYNALVHVLKAGSAAFDMSAYATGSLKFDLKVISDGDTDQGVITSKVACGYPCESTEQQFTPGTLGSWQSVDISVEDLVSAGLDLSKVSSAFEIAPRWNQQTNVHFQLDNIRWVTGSSAVQTVQCYSQHFDGGYSSILINMTSGAGITSDWVLGLSPKMTLQPDWSSNDYWGFGIQGGDNIKTCIDHGTYSADVYIPKAYVDDGTMLIGLYADNGSQRVILDSGTSAASLLPDQWNRIKFTLTGDVALANTSTLGVYFKANGKPVDVTGNIMLDNFVISQPVD